MFFILSYNILTYILDNIFSQIKYILYPPEICKNSDNAIRNTISYLFLYLQDYLTIITVLA